MYGGKLNLEADVGVAKCKQQVQLRRNADVNVGVGTQIGPLSFALACPGNPCSFPPPSPPPLSCPYILNELVRE